MKAELVFSPSDFVAVSNQIFEQALPFVEIEGEIAEFKVRKNQWVYFKVKDEYSSVDCFGTVYSLPGPIEDGLMVRIAGRPRMHEKFGFSFNFSALQPVGEGSLGKAFELLKAKLAKEGLFEPNRKRSLAYPPTKVALLTSAQGAARADFEKIIDQRWPSLEVDLIDVFVQGQNSVSSIVSAIEAANQTDKYDVLVIVRGGGSAEDLNSFNDERLVRAVAGSRTPTLLAIGHETDQSLAEMAADKSASTPSNAAELLVPDIKSERALLKHWQSFFNENMRNYDQKISQQFESYSHLLAHRINNLFSSERLRLNGYDDRLRLVDPDSVLKRGYALISQSGKVLSSVKQLSKGQEVKIKLQDGQAKAEVK